MLKNSTKIDVLCSVSESEAFGRTLVEGMLSGCLVIAAKSKTSAASEIIDNQQTGLLYKLHDSKELTLILENILSGRNRILYQKLALNGQKSSHEKFTSYVNSEKS